MSKTGRPIKYTAQVADAICAELATGKSLRQICATEGLPDRATVARWLATNEAFRDQYARAREIGLDSLADEALEIADTCRNGEKVKRVATGGRICSECDRLLKWQGRWIHAATRDSICPSASAEILYEEEIVTADMVERSRLQVDARKWYLAKLAPKKYGEKLNVEQSGADGGPIEHRVTVRLVESPEHK